MTSLANEFDAKGGLPGALELDFQGLVIAEANRLLLEKSICLNNIGSIFWHLNDFSRAISSFKHALQVTKKVKSNMEQVSSKLVQNERF